MLTERSRDTSALAVVKVQLESVVSVIDLSPSFVLRNLSATAGGRCIYCARTPSVKVSSRSSYVAVGRKEDRGWLLVRIFQHAPETPCAGFLIGHGLTGKETLLPGDDLVFGMGCGGPVDAGLDIAKGMTNW